MVYINGRLIKGGRQEKGLSCRDLAVILNTTQKTIRVWERYPAKISPRNLWRICKIIDMNPENLKINVIEYETHNKKK